MTKFITTVVLVSMLLSITGVGYGKGNSKVAYRQFDDKPSKQTETRVYIRNQCILSEFVVPAPKAEVFGAIAAIFLPMLIKKALGGASAAIKKAGDPDEIKDSGRLPTYLYKVSNEGKVEKKVENGVEKEVKSRGTILNPDLGCILIVRGTFSKPDEPVHPANLTQVTFPEPGLFLDEKGEEKRKARLNANDIPVLEIAAVFEAAILMSNDRTAIYYESRFLEVNSFQGTRDSNTRAIVVSIAINGAGAKDGDSTLSLSLLNLGEIAKGKIKGPNQLKSIKSSWLGGLGISDEALAYIETLKPNATPKIMPVTIEGTIIETEKGSKALRFIAEVLDATKDDLSETLSKEILKDPNKAKEEKANALEKLRQEEEEAYAAYLNAELERAKLDPKATEKEKQIKDFEVERTKRAWCIKFNALTTLGAGPTGRKATCP